MKRGDKAAEDSALRAHDSCTSPTPGRSDTFPDLAHDQSIKTENSTKPRNPYFDIFIECLAKLSHFGDYMQLTEGTRLDATLGQAPNSM